MVSSARESTSSEERSITFLSYLEVGTGHKYRSIKYTTVHFHEIWPEPNANEVMKKVFR